jgi:limonene-1,2-epoxide hydrolase
VTPPPPAAEEAGAGELDSPSPGPERAIGVVRSFLGCAPERDWQLAASLLDPAVTREGADGSVIAGRQAYLEFLRDVLPADASYRSEVVALAATADGGRVLVELREELVPAGGEALRASEVMVFVLTPERRIGSISVFAKQP